MNNSSIVCFGELLIDMISTNPGSLQKAEGFLKKFGGAPANTAADLAKLGVPVRFIGKVGDDPFGHFLKGTLEDYGVETSSLIFSRIEKTTLAFVSLTESGERDFTFYKGAHEAIKPSEVNLPKDTFLFHFGSLTQTNDEANKATHKLIDQAASMDAIISYDPNIRESLWEDLNRAQEIILDTAKKVDILKINEDEANLLSGKENIPEAGSTLFTDNLEAIFITLGGKGCYYKTKAYEGFVPVPIRVETIDTTGAGDAFNAGYIFAIHETGKRIPEMTKEELELGLKRANIIGALTTTKKGAIDACPTIKDLKQYI
mgnify:CR=1 FL=1